VASKRKCNQLNDRQRNFIREYLDPNGANLNGTQAAIRAGYSAKTANEQAARLLAKASISDEIERQRARRTDRLQITADRVLKELALLGFSNMQDYIRVTEAGSALVDLSELDRERAAAIQEITVEEYVEGRGDDAERVRKTKFKLADKRGSLELLGKHLGVFENTGQEKRDLLQELDRASRIPLENEK
jgi:phage terminase small subunit